MADLGRGEGPKSKGKKTAIRQSRSCRVCRLRKVKVGILFLSIFLLLQNQSRMKMMDVFVNGKSNIRLVIREVRLF